MRVDPENEVDSRRLRTPTQTHFWPSYGRTLQLYAACTGAAKKALGIPREMMSKPLLLSGLVATAAGHAAATHPKPRQAIDGSIHPWNGTVPDPIPFTNPANWCA